MSDHFYSSAKKNTYSEEPTYLPTGQKSHYRLQSQGFFQRTPEKNLTFSEKKGSRLSDAKRSIDECLNMASQKRRMNQQAFGEVKQINNEILGSLSWLNPVQKNLFEPRNKTTEQHRREDSRENVATSQFEWKPFTSPQRIHQQELRSNLSLQDKYVTHENLELKSQLNTEIKKNNDLLQHISYLQGEVNSLRASKYQVSQSGNYNQVLQENRYLRNQLAKSQLGSRNYNLIQELQRLKAENTELRRDTITLLKSRQY